MGRAPCCEKVGLKKGPWSKEEDHILINYINQHGHENWRALPKKAGLLRCGKSCRLRWTNYLRSDIKRGNFSKEEEDTIIKLHQALGNRWSTIAARLPGRTDNEIKNVWHTHLKKRLKQGPASVTETKQEQDIIIVESKAKFDHQDSKSSSQKIIMQEQDSNQSSSPQSSCDDISSSVTTTSTTRSILDNPTEMSIINSDPILHNYQEELDQDFWLDVVSSQDHSDITNHGINDSVSGDARLTYLPLSPVSHELDRGWGFDPCMHDDLDFWCNLFTRTEDISELLEF